MSWDKMAYHGTEIERGRKAIEKQRLPISVSKEKKEQWLGDGIYLFKDSVYAYWWINCMHQKNIEKGKYSNEKELYDKFTILKVKYECTPERIFDSEISDHYIIFNKMKDYCEEKDKKRHKEGEIFNILFNEFELAEQFDVVRWCYSGNTRMIDEARLRRLPQVQICIKKPNIIQKIEEIEETEKEKVKGNFGVLFERNDYNGKYGTKMVGNKRKTRWNVK